jgi:hypothetical protein
VCADTLDEVLQFIDHVGPLPVEIPKKETPSDERARAAWPYVERAIKDVREHIASHVEYLGANTSTFATQAGAHDLARKIRGEDHG